MGCLTSCNRAQNWRAIVSLLIDQGLSSGANNVSHPRTATWRTRTCLRDACVIPDAASLDLQPEEGAGVSSRTVFKPSWVNMQAYKEKSSLDIRRSISCSATPDLKQNWRVRCLLITVNPTGAAVFSSCRGSQDLYFNVHRP